MKSKELIKLLQEIDPSGEIEVNTYHGDIYGVQRMPAYYDGRLNVFIRDNNINNGYFDIIGIKEITNGERIDLVSYNLEDLMHENWDNPDFIVEGDERFKARAETYKKQAIEVVEKVKFDSFKKYCLKIIDESGILFATSYLDEIIQDFYFKNKDILNRKDFNSINSSINTKHTNYWNDCIKIDINGSIDIDYIKGFENKKYEY